jgi:hypothetical protein
MRHNKLGDIPSKLETKYSPPPNENAQTDESIGSLGISRQNFGGSIYQQSPAWDINSGVAGSRSMPGFNAESGSIDSGSPVPLKGIAKSPTSISPTSPIGSSSSDYSSTEASKIGGPEGTYSTNVNSNLPRSQNNEPYQMSPKSSPVPHEDMNPDQYLSFLFSRDSILHNPYKGKE